MAFNLSSILGSKKLTGAVATAPSIWGLLELLPPDLPVSIKAGAGATVGLAYVVQIAGQSIVDIIKERNKGLAELAAGRSERDKVLGKTKPKGEAK